MRKALFIMFLIISCCLKAQEEEKSTIGYCEGGYSDELPFKKGQYYFPVSSKITVYSRPDARSKVFCQTKGYSDTIRIEEVLNKFPNYFPSKFKNIYGYWCKVAFPLNGKRFIGYIPSQFLTRAHIRDGEKTYLVNLESYKNDTFMCSFKIIHNNDLVFQQTFLPIANNRFFKFEKDTISVNYAGYFDIRLSNNQGLRGVERILYVNSGYPACGYWNGSNIFFIKENKVIKYLEDGGVVDGGEYMKRIEYCFPQDSLALADTIIKKEEEYEVLSDVKDLYWKSIVKYYWDGSQLEKADSTYIIKIGKPYEGEKVDTAR